MENQKEGVHTSSTEVPSTETQDPTKVDLWVIRRQLETELRPIIRQEYQQLFNFWKENELAELDKKKNEIIRTELAKLHEEWVKKQTPPTENDLQKILSQEYTSFKFEVQIVNEDIDSDKEPEVKTYYFMIRELPSAIERKFYNAFKTRLLDKAGEIQAVVQASMNTKFEDRLKKTLDLFEDSFEVLAEGVVMCLNPFGKKSIVTKEWVQNSISLDRQWRVIEAQIEVNRLRDFFSKISQSGLTTMTTLNGVDIHQLQQRAQ